MDPGKIFQIITNSTLLATRLLPGSGGPVQFSEPRYCVWVPEDAPPAVTVARVVAQHREGVRIRYSITAGNKDGLFTIDPKSGLITLAAALDYELQPKHELVVAANGAGKIVHSIVQVTVQDVNDNPPEFLQNDLQVSLTEEESSHLPTTILKVEAYDVDNVDEGRLLYSIGGDGVDGYSEHDAYFTINRHSGDLIQLKALDRDPPNGRGTWQVRVQVRDGQRVPSSLAGTLKRQPRGIPPRHPPNPVQEIAAATTTAEASEGPREEEEARYHQYEDFDITQERNRLSRGAERGGGEERYSGDFPAITEEGYKGQISPPRLVKRSERLSQESYTTQTRPFSPEEFKTVGRDSHVDSTNVQDSYIDSTNVLESHIVSTNVQDSHIDSTNIRESRDHRQYTPHLDSLGNPTTSSSHRSEMDATQSFGNPVADRKINPYRDKDVDGENNGGIGSSYFDILIQSERENGLTNENSNYTDLNISKEKDRSTPRIKTTAEIRERNLRDRPRRNIKGLITGCERCKARESKVNVTGKPERPELPNISSPSGNKRQDDDGKLHAKFAPRERWEEDSANFRDEVAAHARGEGGEGEEEGEDVTTPGSSRSSGGSSGKQVEKHLWERLRLNHFSSGEFPETDTIPGLSPLPTPPPPPPLPPGDLKLTHSSPEDFANKEGQTYEVISDQWVEFLNPHMKNIPPEASPTHFPSDVKDANLKDFLFSTTPIDDNGTYSSNYDLVDIQKYEEGLFYSYDDSSTDYESHNLLELSLDPSGDIPNLIQFDKGDEIGEIDPTKERDGDGPKLRPLSYYVKRSTTATNSGGCKAYGGARSKDGTRGGASVYGAQLKGSDGSIQSGKMAYFGEHDRVHVVETVVTVTVKDINDNSPVFPNTTIYGEVQENGPIDLSVGVVSAWDADDAAEGTNARLKYTIEENVRDERSGQPIFAIHPDTGRITTTVCCLDRETIPEYRILIVAKDGGGRSGTGTVVVRLADVNDNSPRLARELWETEVNETWGSSPPDNSTLIQLATVDHDTSNYFFYRVVEGSGWGWQYFGMRTKGNVGELFVQSPLDYEDPSHRRGFRFMVQVTDRGRGGWDDARHTDTAWVSVQLRDLNDNPPEFRRSQVHVSVSEDIAPGTLLATLPAKDPDMAGHQGVKYFVNASWGALTVDSGGGVRLWRNLDREAVEGDSSIAEIISVDEGRPPQSSTASLTITVTDVNDCPPRLLPPTVLYVTEGMEASNLGMLTATDDDKWALGHGPPFTFNLSPSNPEYVLQLLDLIYESAADSGRGGAEVWTKGPIDREQYPQLTVEVVVSDAGKQAASQPVTVIIGDVNDNQMRPAAKTVYLWKMQGGGSDAALGRVYVEDPDDWDLKDKTFAWAGPPHPLFSLHSDSGAIFASAHLREGRYELQFSVSDSVWRQYDVRANVTVVAKYLQPEALAHAIPITLTPTTPSTLTSGWTPKRGGGGLGTLANAVKEVVGDTAKTVEIVSVYGNSSPDSVYYIDLVRAKAQAQSSTPKNREGTHTSRRTPSASTWVSVKEQAGSYMDPVKLQGLLALHLNQLEERMKLQVSLEDPVNESTNSQEDSLVTSSAFVHHHNPSSLASMASTALPLQVVDTNSTSLVTPRLSRSHDCHAHARERDDSCTHSSCLNGGRCLRTGGGSRCICPGGSWGRRCKVLSRSFQGNGWAWVHPLPQCLPTTLSLRILTRRPHALLLYSGPLSSVSPFPQTSPTPMLAVQLIDGRPQVLLEGPRGTIKLQVNTTLNNGKWHNIHLHVNSQSVTLIVDRCGREWAAASSKIAHCLARASWLNPLSTGSWVGSVPLQVGGLAHPQPQPQHFGWSIAPVHHGLRGCISHLKINRQFVDLGEPAYSSSSSGGCETQDRACVESCGFRGRCTGGLNRPKCECDPGWTGSGCVTATTPAFLGPASFMKMTLLFTPNPHFVNIQLRMRTQGQITGLLMQLVARQSGPSLSVQLRGGIACVSLLKSEEELVQEACVDGYPLGDGSWHVLKVARHGVNVVISVDDGDGWRKNDTFLSAVATTSVGGLQSLVSPQFRLSTVTEHGTLTLGGIPEYLDNSLVKVHDDLKDTCIDDVRVSGYSLPLSPGTNMSDWGRVTSVQHVEKGCVPPNLCTNTTCVPPLTCQSSWSHSSCGCAPGTLLVGGSCQDIDECAYGPCLNGGTCHNQFPGYQCSCNPLHAGENCQWKHLSQPPHSLTPPMAIAVLTLSLLVIVVVGVLVTIWFHRSRAGRTGTLRSPEVEVVAGVGSVAGALETHLASSERHDSRTKEELVLLESLKLGLPSRQSSPGGSIKQPMAVISTADLPYGTFPGKKEGLISSLESIINVGSDSSNNKRGKFRRRSLDATGNVQRGSFSRRVKHLCIDPDTSNPRGVFSIFSTTPDVAQDDLRAYAYEGEGSPPGSLTSTVLGLRSESLEDENIRPLLPEYGEVFDLLKDLPDASTLASTKGSSSKTDAIPSLPIASISRHIGAPDIKVFPDTSTNNFPRTTNGQSNTVSDSVRLTHTLAGRCPAKPTNINC